MQIDEYLNQAKWPILEIVAKSPQSPINIADEIDTSVAYVSQQLKLLEAVGLVKKSKTGEFLKGKPRSLYSLSEDLIHITSLLRGQPQKKIINPNDRQKYFFNVWLYENEKLQYALEKFYWALDDLFENIDGLYIDNSQSKERVIIFCNDKKTLTLINSFFKKELKDVDLKQYNSYEEYKKKLDDLYILFERNKLKGIKK